MRDTPAFDRLFHLVHLFKRRLHDEVEQLQLSLTPMHVRVLKIITKQPDCTAVDVASHLARDKAQITRLMKTLLDEGFIGKRPNPNDKRSQCLQPTAKGDAVLEQLRSIEANLHRQMTLEVSDEQLGVFASVTSQLAANLEKKRGQ
uniref:MarR family winged helix-turn-helix transcriptional regulator n=1 Tax=Thaumasiovibrio occultus TaxID=1891184 RepID=UPI000B35F856|nr:MarR family transcriptional regulator [Thaumasiovibrio occultus]